MKNVIKEDEDYILVTKNVKRYLAPFFGFLGFICIGIFFIGYLSIFSQDDSITFFGITILQSFFTGFIDLFLAISGGFLLGTIYFCCWNEGWEIRQINDKISEILFFWGFGKFKKVDKYQTKEITTIYVKKIPIDELNTFFIYKLQFEAKNTRENETIKKVLLIDTDYNQIHSIGVKALSLLHLDHQLQYK